jgi:hypothetical protein
MRRFQAHAHGVGQVGRGTGGQRRRLRDHAGVVDQVQRSEGLRALLRQPGLQPRRHGAAASARSAAQCCSCGWLRPCGAWREMAMTADGHAPAAAAATARPSPREAPVTMERVMLMATEHSGGWHHRRR